MFAVVLCCLAAAPASSESRGLTNAEAVCGTWVLQQVGSRQELDRLASGTLEAALNTPHVRGFCLRAHCEVYAPSFSLPHKAELAFEIRKFAARCDAGGITP